MTDIWFVDPPDPPEGQEWCLMCLMLAKNRITEKHPNLAVIAADPKIGVHWVPWDNKITLMPALCRGITNVPQLGLVPVCWSHLAIVIPRQGPSLLDGGQIPHGLLRGRG